jgi:membrane protein
MPRYPPVRLLKAVIAVANERNVKTTAASVAFYMFNTAIPFALLGFVLLSYFGHIDLLRQAIELVVGDNLRQFQAIVDRVSDDPAGRRRAVVIAAGILVWSAFQLFQTVDSAFAEVYDERAEASLLTTVFNTTLVLAVVISGVGGVGVVGALLSFRAESAAWVPYTTVFMFVLLLAVFLPMYSLFPRADTPLGEALPGTVLAAAGWTVSAGFFRVYLNFSANPYGLAGAVLLLLTWLYVGGLLLLLGGVLNAVLGGHVEVDLDWLPGPSEK